MPHQRIQGQTKKVAGTVTGDEDPEAQGKAERQTGEAEEKVEEVKDRVQGFIDDVKDKAGELAGKAKDMLHNK